MKIFLAEKSASPFFHPFSSAAEGRKHPLCYMHSAVCWADNQAEVQVHPSNTHPPAQRGFLVMHSLLLPISSRTGQEN